MFRSRFYSAFLRRSASHVPHRPLSTPKSTATPTQAPTPTATTTPSAPTSSPAFTKLVSRTPKFLRPTISALHAAPITHITAFILLHELTAVIPLFALAGSFHYYHWLPPYFAEGTWVLAGVEKFGKYFKRKGWIGVGEEAEVESRAREGADMRKAEKTGAVRWWDRGEGGMRWVVEFATAYAIVKALLPLRIVVSVWGAPWFARWTIIPVSSAVKRIFGRKKRSGGKAVSANAGTNNSGPGK